MVVRDFSWTSNSCEEYRNICDGSLCVFTEFTMATNGFPRSRSQKRLLRDRYLANFIYPSPKRQEVYSGCCTSKSMEEFILLNTVHQFMLKTATGIEYGTGTCRNFLSDIHCSQFLIAHMHAQFPSKICF